MLKNNAESYKAQTMMNSQYTNKCPVCNGTGYMLQEISTDESKAVYGDNRLVPYACICTHCNGGHAEKVERIKKHAEIPPAYYDSNLSMFNWDIYMDEQGKKLDLSLQRKYIESFVEHFNEWEKTGVGLYICSKTRGSGKTFLASCICNSLIEKYPMNTKFVSASELIDIQKNASETGTEYERDPIALLCNCKLLVIDDLGQKQTGADWLNDILFRIIDNRTQKKLVTIITSNFEMRELQLESRTVGRIDENCKRIPLPEFCVRSRVGKQKQLELFGKLGLINR